MIAKLLQPEVQKYIKDHQFDDPFVLSLKSKTGADFPVKEAIEQIQSLQKARYKIPAWVATENIIWPPPVSIEQSSSELTAKFKAGLIQGKSMIDLTGGMGIDASFFIDCFEEVHYVENNAHLVELARHNFKALSMDSISVHESSAEEYLGKSHQKVDAIFIDPSRRLKNKKVFRIEDCTPNLYEIVPKCMEITNQLLIKLSPMIDLSLLVKEFSPSKVWVVSLKNEVKEVLCLIPKKKTSTQILAVDLLGDEKKATFEFELIEERNAESTYSLPMKYVYEPAAAVMKTGAFKLIGQRFGLNKIQMNSHLYTSEELVHSFPGRVYLMLNQMKLDKKEILGIAPEKKINVMTRNYPLSAEQLKNKLALKDGGEKYLIGTTLMNGKKALLHCERLS